MTNVATIEQTTTQTELPTNIEGEAMLLAAMMINNDIVPAVSKLVDASDFSVAVHGRLFAAITERVEAGKLTTPILLRPQFEADEGLKELGGLPYLARLTGEMAGLLAPLDIASQIRELAGKRTLISGLTQALDAVHAGNASEAQQIVADALEAAPKSAHAELDLFSPAQWQGTTAPHRQWRLEGLVPDYQATLLTGAGAAGKSLSMQQMSTCIAMGVPFLGVEVKQCPTLYITCEDDIEELHRRQMAICEALRIRPADTEGKLFLLSLQGRIGNELATFDQEGKMHLAPRYFEIERACLTNGVKHVTIDNTAHTFAGNENDRHQVAAFVNLNNKLAARITGSVVMVGHPNKAGDSYSGSTAWENQVRSRLYLEVPKSDEGEPVDPDMRVLRNEKANYSRRGEEVRFYWLKGAFVTEEDMPQGNERDMRDSAAAASENAMFLRLLDKLTEQRRQVSHARNVGTYAPKVMARMTEARGMTQAQFEKAMERLFLLDEIVASVPLWNGTNRHPVYGIARKKGGENA